MNQHTLHQILHTSSKKDFLRDFRHFCATSLPKNLGLRQQLSTSILETSTISTALLPLAWYNKIDLLPPLVDKWTDIAAERILAKTIAHIEIKEVSEQSLRTLQPGVWINDEIISAYSKLLLDENDARVSSPFMIAEIKERRMRVNREIDYKYLQTCGQLFIPFCQLSHWSFIRLTTNLMSTGKPIILAEHYNSLPEMDSSSLLVPFKVWFRERFPDIEMNLVARQSPRQRNSDDCGVFVLMGIRLMSLGSDHLTQREADEIIPNFRHRVLAELLANKIDPTIEDYDTFMKLDREASQRAPFEIVAYEISGSGKSGDPICLDSPLLPLPPTPNFEQDRSHEALDTQIPLPSSPEGLPFLTTYLDAQLLSSPLIPAHELSEEENGAAMFCHDSSEFDIAALFDKSPSIVIPISGPSLFGSSPDSPSSDHSNVESFQGPIEKRRICSKVQNLTLNIKPEPKAKQPKTFKRKRSEVDDFIVSFGDQEFIISSLQTAVRLYRAKKRASEGQISLASLWAEVGSDEAPQYAVSQRHAREMFSRRFYSEVARLGGSRGHINFAVRAKLCVGLGCAQDLKIYKAAQSQASRSGVWTDLVDCVAKAAGISVVDAGVAICGCKETTTAMENLSQEQRQRLIQGIQTRLLDKFDHLLQTFLEASRLYKAVIEGSLPDYTLPIERKVDLEVTDFAAAVAVLEAPSRVPLPRGGKKI